ncbi:MAG: hypothetical protein RL318_1374 [Fibrobacterota bacterium]|jgi:hypothetical protein
MRPFKSTLALGIALALLSACDASQLVQSQEIQSAPACLSDSAQAGCVLREGTTFLGGLDTLHLASRGSSKDSLTAVVVYPAGCSTFDGIESRRSGDTLFVAARHFLPTPAKDLLCAHGSGLDTIRFQLDPTLMAGVRWLTYAKAEPYRESPLDTITLPFQQGHDQRSFFDTLILPKPGVTADSLAAVVVYPAGCNAFDRLDQTRSGDTLDLVPVFHTPWIAPDIECAHGSGLDTIKLAFDPSRLEGIRHLRYPKGRPWQNAPDSTILQTWPVP